jgi:hypothetical protein
MPSIGALSMRIPVRSPTLIGLDFPLTTLIGIVGKRTQLLTCTEKTTRANLERLCSARLIQGDQKITHKPASIRLSTIKQGLYKRGSWWNFAMTSPETSHMKKVTNKLSFPLVTHTTYFDIRLGCYGIWNSCFSFGHIMDRLDCSWSIRFLGQKMGETY